LCLQRRNHCEEAEDPNQLRHSASSECLLLIGIGRRSLLGQRLVSFGRGWNGQKDQVEAVWRLRANFQKRNP
jgi:hypothetical protein